MRFLDELKNLNLPKDKYAIFGSGPIGIRNLREVNDIDIIVKEDLWENLIKEYSLNETKGCIQIGQIEIFNNWSPWFNNVNKLIDTAEIINELPFVRLDYVMEWKSKLGREKDFKDLSLIKNYINSLDSEL